MKSQVGISTLKSGRGQYLGGQESHLKVRSDLSALNGTVENIQYYGTRMHLRCRLELRQGAKLRAVPSKACLCLVRPSWVLSALGRGLGALAPRD